MSPDAPPRFRALSYWVIGLGLTGSLTLTHGIEWRGSAELHTVMEVMATLLALIVGAMSLVRYYSKIDNVFLFVGAGFLGTGFLDGYHAIVTLTYFKPFMPSDLPALIPWSWVASRQFLSIMMFLSCLAWLREERLGEAGRIKERTVYMGSGIFTLASFLFFAFVPLPRTYYPEIFFHRPEEFAPALFFLLALIGYLKKGFWRSNAFEYWLVLSLIVGFIGQAVFMSHSGVLFDYEFDVAHTLKKLSYVCVLTGLMFSMFLAFKKEEATASELRKSLQKNLDSEGSIRAIVDTVVDGIITIGEAGNIETFNPAAAKIFGFKMEEMIGRNVKMLMPDPYHSEHDGYLAAYRDTGEARIIGIVREVTGRRKDGTEFPMDLSISEMEVSGKRIFTGIVRDISERVEADRMKSEFVSTVSHELRTPLTAIRGALGLVGSGVFGDMTGKATRMIDLAQSNTERLINLVNDLLTMEKLQSGEMDFHMERVSLTDILIESVKVNKPFADEHKVTFEVTGTIPDAFVNGDHERLGQVIANLLSNAAKFSPEGDIVEISLVRREDYFRVSVSDRGPGIPEEFRRRLFDRFSQADSSDSRQKGGTGLGLNISMSIVERHGGEIDVESSLGEGSTFFFDLPEHGNDRLPSPGPVDSVDGADKPQTISGQRILVIEDDPDVAEFMAIMLEQYGAVCDTAHNVIEARTKLAKSTYQVITLDMLLPDGNGVSFLQELRANDATKNIPVVVVSVIADESREDVLTSVMGVMDWLQKPIDENRLIRAIKRGVDLSSNGHNSILIVEDDANLSEVLTNMIGDLADVTLAATLEQARHELETTHWSLVILDIGLPDGSGVDLIPLLKIDGKPPTPVIIFSADEVDSDIANKVERALVKSRTSNEELIAMIEEMISKPGGPPK